MKRRRTFQQIQEKKDSGNSESSGDNNNNVKRRSLNGRRLKRPSDGPSTPSTPSKPKDENISLFVILSAIELIYVHGIIVLLQNFIMRILSFIPH
ncbi:uncharacterized protein OCT59_012890 [Rhizophagus irregularis]|uniref:uncharacterized protein n=1 Tax=Rhizophagus irregularis TaxID=588596 RepID=UPI000CAE6190|nr:hypothetical protein OCT59_012890 [Rhizophagus irregularis]GBC31946.1 hypothetical protein GLOIN_2v1772217 [Rhizophagus irregularis DAOM 181602=DAOM 197198]